MPATTTRYLLTPIEAHALGLTPCRPPAAITHKTNGDWYAPSKGTPLVQVLPTHTLVRWPDGEEFTERVEDYNHLETLLEGAIGA